MLKNILMLLLKTNPFAGLINVVNHYLNKSFFKKFLLTLFLHYLHEKFFKKISILESLVP